MQFQEERLDDVLEELEPLLQEHYKEVAMYQDKIELNPDYDLYRLMERQGTLHILTARDPDLQGYCVTFINKHPHYKDHKYAVNDIIYVSPEHRHTDVAYEMLKELERLMLLEGVSVMTFHMKHYKSFQTLMSARHFDPAEYLYTKYIGE